MKKLLAILVMVVMLLIPSIAISDPCDVCEFLDYRIGTGLIMSYNIEFNEVYVHPVKWYNTPLIAKKYFLSVASKCFDCHGSTGRVTIYDGYSGKKLAKFSVWGTTFY